MSEDVTWTAESLKESLEVAVLEAYDDTRDELEEFEDAPDLEAIYQTFVANVQDNMIEEYQDFFGQGTTPRQDWAYDIGLSQDGIPNILTVCSVLNAFKVPYTYNGTLYNYMTRRLLPRLENIEDDAIY